VHGGRTAVFSGILGREEATMHSIFAHDAVDLHLHTLASDGRWTVAELIDYLATKRFRVAALCDHDTMAAVDDAIELGKKYGLVIVPGVEVTTRWADRQWHLLVYGVDPALPTARAFRAILDELADRLWAEAARAIVALERNGYRLRALREIVGGRPLRPHHVLLALIQEGSATNLATAHEITKRLGEPMTVDVPLSRAVAAAHEAGGICILAHPGRDDGAGVLTVETLERMRMEIPIDGLEAHYRSHTLEQTETLRAWCARFGLLASAGSDSHAPGHPVDPIPYPAVSIAGLLRRFAIDVLSEEDVSEHAAVAEQASSRAE
jgi:predicted metal-dependent phosphoesterase TrpH